jgi:hypothetical protein
MRSFASGIHYERRESRNRLTMRFVEVQDAAHGAASRLPLSLDAHEQLLLDPLVGPIVMRCC